MLLVPAACARGEPPERPVWFPVGTSYRVCNPGSPPRPPRDDDIVAEVYQENDCLTVQTNVLQFIQQPRWFKGTKPPDSIPDIPMTNQGASLSLQIKSTGNPTLLRLVLTLKAEERSVWRELEHRWTNTIPFLFAVTVDGKPIDSITPQSWGKLGGVDWMREQVPSGKSKTWDILLGARSVTLALNHSRRTAVTIVAAFSEYQHQPLALFGGSVGDGVITADFKGPPITVRSNEATLEYNGETLKPRADP